jgi:N-acetylmuramic acid 6-phosphate (MurNAc-6-P) etherase
MEVCEIERHSARELLIASNGIVKTAIVMHFLGTPRDEAEQALERSGGVIRRAVNRDPPPVRSS